MELTKEQEKAVQTLENKGYTVDLISDANFEVIVYLSKKTKTGAELRQVDEDGEIN